MGAGDEPPGPVSHAQPLLSDDGGATHCPLALQTLGDQQSATDVHVVLQPFLHTYGAQFCDGPLGGCEV